MTQINPLLADSALPPFAAIKPEHVEPAIDAVLAAYTQEIHALTADASTRTFENTMLPQQALERGVERARSP